MYVICDEMWNSVDIYGPQPEIDRFKRLCIVPAPPDYRGNGTLAIDFSCVCGGSRDGWNFRELGDQEPGIYSFAFDSLASFPVWVFEDLARMFPTLAFDCECIADDDSSMGYGWFNTPPGGEDFFDGYEVPQGYWETGADKRTPAQLKRHLAVIAAFRRSLQKAEDNS